MRICDTQANAAVLGGAARARAARAPAAVRVRGGVMIEWNDRCARGSAW